MAARTATKKTAKPVVREETAKTVIDETTTAEATARELAASFVSENMTKDERLFEQARVAFAGISTGAKASDIAKATATAVAAYFPESDREWALNTSVVNGGAKVSRVTIQQRSDAYSAILSAGIAEPTTELVCIAFRAFTSKGAPGLADAHKALIKETLRLDEGERANHYRENARVVAGAVEARKRADADSKRSESAAKGAADRKAERPADVVFVESAPVDAVIATIREAVNREWSDDDRALLMAALAEIVGA